MALSRKRTTGRAPPAGNWELYSVATGGGGHLNVTPVINIGTGKIPVSNPTVSSQLPSSQLLTPSTTNIAEKPVVDPEAVPSRDEEPKPPQKQESKPQVNLSKDQIQEVQGWLRAYRQAPSFD